MNFLHQTFDFSGSKIALMYNNCVLTILRDDKLDIPYPNHWDLPGGGRENEETPFECLTREVFEELGLQIKLDQVIWVKSYPGMVNPDKQSIFMVGKISQEEFASISFGDEGQAYQLMPIAEFLKHEKVIPQLQGRLKDYMEETK